ncbi:MAG: type II secretion system F family protein [Verrucomicrobiae bacterium]|nr:type II secretion system F family protein [Verrucomicrobiae bacterium]
MALMTSTAAGARPMGGAATRSGKKMTFLESQRLAKRKALERSARRKRINLEHLTFFTQQLASMLEAGLPLVSALEAMEEQTENPVFQIIIRDVRNDVASGTPFSEACAKFPNAFPNLFLSMVEAGEASGGLGSLLKKVSEYFEASVKLAKKVKGAMTYPVAVIVLAILLVAVLLIKVIPVFAQMFADFGKELPRPTQILIDVSEFLQQTWWMILMGLFAFQQVLSRIIRTPRGRWTKDRILYRLPIIGQLSRKIALSRFCRTYAILLRSGVPILTALDICSKASGNTFIEAGCKDISRNISQGGQLSDTVAEDPYFPPMVRHMAKAGEQTGNVDGMLEKVSDFYDVEINTTVESLTSLMEPLLIVFLGVVIGSIVMAMFMPIFQLTDVVSS